MFCTHCANSNAPSARFCTNCGRPLAAQTAAETAGPADQDSHQGSDLFKPQGMSHADYAYGDLPPAPASSGRSKGAIIAIAIGAVAVVIAVIAAIGFGQRAALTSSLPRQTDTYTDSGSGTDTNSDSLGTTGWAPAGYTEYGYDLAYMWTTDSHTSDCADCTYWFMDVVANTGCSDIYAEINILDADGNVIDWSNDTVPALAAGQNATLEFNSYETGASSAEVTDLSCY